MPERKLCIHFRSQSVVISGVTCLPTGTCFIHGPPLLLYPQAICKGGPCMEQVPVVLPREGRSLYRRQRWVRIKNPAPSCIKSPIVLLEMTDGSYVYVEGQPTNTCARQDYVNKHLFYTSKFLVC